MMMIKCKLPLCSPREVELSVVWRCGGAYAEDKGHEATEDCEEDVPSFIAEAASSLKENESGDKQGANGIQERPMHGWQQSACRGLAFALCMCQPLSGLQDLSHICSSPPVQNHDREQADILRHIDRPDVCTDMQLPLGDKHANSHRHPPFRARQQSDKLQHIDRPT